MKSIFLILSDLLLSHKVLITHDNSYLICLEDGGVYFWEIVEY